MQAIRRHPCALHRAPVRPTSRRRLPSLPDPVDLLVSMNSDPKFEEGLQAAARAARAALRDVEPLRDELLTTLCEFEYAVESAQVTKNNQGSSGVRDAIDAFEGQYGALRDMLDGLVDRTAADLAGAYADLARDADYVTLMLFGRTRAGKSTTMEALTGGDGASIGIGRQHTTKEVRAYYFPSHSSEGAPTGPALRIVDTPGIEGFEGEALAAMAEEFVERCDHILFLLTDDKATSDELQRFGLIRTQSKGVTVLLNVKAADEDLDLLVAQPDLIFRAQELDGHLRRITGYLERNFDMDVPKVLPFHARGAWLGSSNARLPDGITDRHSLRVNSRLADVRDRIAEFISYEAIPARIRAPRDLLGGYIEPLKDELRPFAGQFRKMMSDIEQLVRRLESGTERARSRVAARFPLLRARFQAASDEVSGVVDTVISQGGRGGELNSEWRSLLARHGIEDAAGWFIASGQQDFEAELSEEVRAASADYEFAAADDLDELLNDYHEADRAARRHKYAKAGIRAGAGGGAAALAAWAIANWWNPIGWAAAGAAALVALAAVGGEAAARKATDAWERSTRRELQQRRAELIEALRERIWADYRGVRAACDGWLDETKALHLDVAREVARPIQLSAAKLWQATVACLDALDRTATQLHEGLIVDLLAHFVPEVEAGEVQIGAVRRRVGFRTKAVVSSRPGSGRNAFAACIGRQGVRIRALRSALGGEAIDLVDGNTGPEEQVLQALAVARTHGSRVVVTERGQHTTARVWLESPTQARFALGPKGTNVRLAENLLGINIVIEGSA